MAVKVFDPVVLHFNAFLFEEFLHEGRRLEMVPAAELSFAVEYAVGGYAVVEEASVAEELAVEEA